MAENDQSATEVDTNNPAPDEVEEAEELGTSDDGTDEGPEPEDDEVEAEYEGKTYKLPKELKDALLRQADYTRKTQEVATERQTIEQQRAEFHENQRQVAETIEIRQAFEQGHTQVAAMDLQLKQYEQVNWQAEAAANPAGTQQAWIQFQQLKSQRDGAAQQVSRLQNEGLQKQQQTVAKLEEKARQEVVRDIKDWSPEVAGKVVAFGKGLGFTDAELKIVQRDARMVKLLHRGMTAEQARVQVQKKPAASAPVAPIKTIKAGSGNSAKDPSKMSADEWQSWRNAQVAKRNRS